MLNIYIKLDPILSKTQAFYNTLKSLWTQFHYHSRVFKILCEHRCNNSTLVTTTEAYSEPSQTSKLKLFIKIVLYQKGFQTFDCILNTTLSSQILYKNEKKYCLWANVRFQFQSSNFNAQYQSNFFETCL